MSDTSAPHPITRPSRRWLMAGSALLGATALVAALTSSHDATAQGTPTSVTATAAQSGSAALARGLPDFADLVEQVGPAVVNIRTTAKVATAARGQAGPDEEMQEFFRRFFGVPMPRRGQPQPDDEDSGGSTPRGVGSGFIVSADGLVMTNAHVIDGADEVIVRLTDKREFKARVVGADKRTDVAVLKIEASGLPTVRFGDVNRLRVGEWVIAIGSPFDLDNTVTAGIVSAKARDTGEMLPFIQTDVAINPGNSGGPLINLRGEVVGINSQIYSRSGGYQGVSFAIPIELASHIKDQIVAHGKVEHARLGVTVQPVNQAFADSFKLPRPEGALVAQVEKGSAADQAGLKAGDVILRADGQAIVDSGDLPARIALARPGDKLPLEVWRNGRAEQLTATLQGAKGKAETVARADGAAHGKLGLALRPLQPDEKRQAQVDGGLRVEQAGGAAAAAGVQAGDVLLSINGQPATSVEQVRGVVAKADKSVALLIERGGQQLFVPVPLA